MLDGNSRQRIIDFADQYLQPYTIRTSGADEKIIPELCPLCHGGSHGKDKRTFALFTANGTFVCKRGSCGRHGRFEDLAKELSGEEVRLVRPASSRAPSEKQYVLPSSEVFPPTEEIYKYFELRKISRETVDAMKIASDAKGNIVFRFYQDGEEVFRKYRAPRRPGPNDRKEWQDSGTKSILYNIDNTVFSRPLIITEGLIDTLSLIEAGISNTVSVPSGCDNNDWIHNNWDYLEKFKTVIIFGDNDEPGKKATANWAKRLGEYRCLIVRNYPEIPNSNPVKYCKDANEILYRLGESPLIEMVESAEDIQVRGLIDVGDIVPYDPTTIPRISTNIPTLDKSIGGLMEGGVTILSGESGHGKSTLASQLLLSAIEAGHKICAYSGELSKEKFLSWLSYQAAGSQFVGLKFDKFLNQNVPFVAPEVERRIQEWLKGKAFLYDNKEAFSKSRIDSILELFTIAVRRHDCSLFLVDNLMSALCEEEEELKAQTKFINNLKHFAESYSVHVLCIAHPRKLKAGMQISRWDVAGSANIVNLADAAIVVERPDIRVIKSRDTGREVLIECCFDPTSRRIYEAAKGDLNKFSWDKSGLTPPKVRADSMPEYGIQLSNTPSTSQPF